MIYYFTLKYFQVLLIDLFFLFQVSISDFLTLFSARTGEKLFFMGARPSFILMCAGLTALSSSTAIATWIPDTVLDEQNVAPLNIISLWVWIYCIICWIIQDICKVIAYKFLYKFNLFQIMPKRKIVLEDEEHPKAYVIFFFVLHDNASIFSFYLLVVIRTLQGAKA